ncbi:hypothetical protein N9L26_02260 [Candidatus Pacebacteria bacterium]|nr:hypothetical protein [Candidatus Paceibacterota bacterium]
MKKQIFAVISDIDVADQLINELHNELSIDSEEISFVYRDKDGEKVHGDGEDIASDNMAEGAVEGAAKGGLIGAVIGLVASVGVLGPLGAVVTAGPIATALGIGGAVGATASGAVLGAATGGLVGALTNLGVGEPEARRFEERVEAGDVLIHVHADDDEAIIAKLNEHNAEEIVVFEENV